MNLELLDPFRPQIPDRVDATLNFPTHLHFPNKAPKFSEDDWKAANHIAFNRRGAYVAVGYGSGNVVVYDVLSRTYCGVYRFGSERIDPSTKQIATDAKNALGGHGVTCLSWSRRSRSLLAGAAGSAEVLLIDTTHPNGPDDCCVAVKKDEKEKLDVVNRDDEERQSIPSEESDPKGRAFTNCFLKGKAAVVHHRTPRFAQVSLLEITNELSAKPIKRRAYVTHTPVEHSADKRYPSIHFSLPLPIGSTLQIHPKDTCAGLAALNDGSLVAFSVPVELWGDNGTEKGDESVPTVKVATIHKSEEHFISCAAFDPHGDKIYAATSTGKLLGFEVSALYDCLANHSTTVPQVQPSFVIHIPGGAHAWHIIVSRNGRYLIVNSVDAAIRLYPTKECWTTPEEMEKPSWVFQDVVSKVKFASCDFSGDGEYVLGGANGSENKYELYIWNTSTGTLMDKLTGAAVELYSVAWHPTRSFVAVAASDGLVDIWGPRINWTAFAPDFQALPQNVEYVECEDEFDITENMTGKDTIQKDDDHESAEVNILAVDPVPTFASDSEDEESVFNFETKVKRILGLI